MRSLVPLLGSNPLAPDGPLATRGAAAAPAGNTIAMATAVDATPTVFAPTVTTGSVSVVLPLVTAAPTIFDPTVTQNAAATAALWLETGDDLLLETGDLWLTESGTGGKVTALTGNTSPLGTDLVLLVDDPAGTPLSQKMTLTVLRTYLLG